MSSEWSKVGELPLWSVREPSEDECLVFVGGESGRTSFVCVKEISGSVPVDALDNRLASSKSWRGRYSAEVLFAKKGKMLLHEEVSLVSRDVVWSSRKV